MYGVTRRKEIRHPVVFEGLWYGVAMAAADLFNHRV